MVVFKQVTKNNKNALIQGTIQGTKISLLIAIAAFQQGCSLSSPPSHASQPVLVMGVSADYPPFEFSQSGKVVGYDIDVANELAKETGFVIEVQDIDFGALIPSLQSGRIDFAMSGMTVNPERQRNVDFSDLYFTSSLALIVPQGSALLSEADFNGKKIGVQLGTTMEKYAKERLSSYPEMQVVSLGRNPILIQEVKTNRLDGMISEGVQAEAFVKANPTLKAIALPAAADGYAIAFPKLGEKNKALKIKFNAALEKLHANGKIEELKKKWLAD